MSQDTLQITVVATAIVLFFATLCGSFVGCQAIVSHNRTLRVQAACASATTQDACVRAFKETERVNEQR